MPDGMFLASPPDTSWAVLPALIQSAWWLARPASAGGSNRSRCTLPDSVPTITEVSSGESARAVTFPPSDSEAMDPGPDESHSVTRSLTAVTNSMPAGNRSPGRWRAQALPQRGRQRECDGRQCALAH